MDTRRQTANERITALILEHLDEGRIPWTQPWVVNSSGIISHATGKPYSLRNRMLLKYGGEYATFNQVRAAGGSVLKGSKSQMVFFGKYIEKKNDADEVVDSYYLPRAYCVFRVGSQTSGIEPKYRDKWEHGGLPKDDSEIASVVHQYCERTKVRIVNAGSECFYSPSDDCVQCVGSDAFKDRSQYWHTMFHELVHSTGHPRTAQPHSSRSMGRLRLCEGRAGRGHRRLPLPRSPQLGYQRLYPKLQRLHPVVEAAHQGIQAQRLFRCSAPSGTRLRLYLW